MLNGKNVNYSMDIESVHITSLTYMSDTCLKRGSSWSWTAMQEDKKHIEENTVTYLIEANNSYKKPVTFKILSITDKLTDRDNIRKTYKEVVMEDVDGEFGKIICNTNEVRANSSASNKSLKNKMSVEYRKTLTRNQKATQGLNKQVKDLTKDLNEAKAVNRIHQQQATRKYAELHEQYTEQTKRADKAENQLVVANNKLEVLEQKLDEVQNNYINKLSTEDYVKIGRLYAKAILHRQSDEKFKKECDNYLATRNQK